LVVNEALSYGCPVIVSDRCGCVPELVIEGVTGLSYNARDTADLAAKMLAAPMGFADTEKTARDCLALMEAYTPDQAATQILAGCRAILTPNDR
jgi:glycosyltransferase involved in cell wall biosynthesis